MKRSSIAEVPDKLPFTEAQQTELDRRLEAYRLNPEEGSPWEYVKENIRQGDLPNS